MKEYEFIKQELPKIIEEYELDESYCRDPDSYEPNLKRMTVYQITERQRQEALNRGYDHVEDINTGSWVFDDGEVPYDWESLWEMQNDAENDLKDGYKHSVLYLLLYRYALHLREEQNK